MKGLKICCVILASLVLTAVVANIFPIDVVCFASEIQDGAAAVAKRPLGDGYFIAMAIFLVLIVLEIVRLVIEAKKLVKAKKSSVKTNSFIPYALATLLPIATFKAILTAEIIVFALLYVANRVVSNKLKNINK